MLRSRLALAIVLLLWVADSTAAEKRLRWSHLDVNASLDRDGVLHVVEKHRMVFDGDWNGGERRFHPRLGQKFQLLRVTRIDRDLSHPLRPGDLANVDEYAWHDTNTLRWRSRMPTDPPFVDQELAYAIEYSVENLLKAAAGEYILDHDFAFPDRDGVIERFTLRLELDPVWISAGTSPVRLERTGLEPGASVVVLMPLRFSADGRPASVPIGTAAPIRIAMAILFVGCATFLMFLWFTAERKTGRFEPLPIESVNRQWLEQNLLQHPPEVVGAAWDDSTGAPEVAAVLARMAGEGKLNSRVEKLSWGRQELFLTLLVPRESLDGYEARLVKALFFEGDNTSTVRIREHYKKKGFSPVGMIRAPVTKLASRLAPGKAKRGAQSPWLRRTLIVIGVAIALLISTAWQGQHDVIGAAAAGGILIALLIFGVIAAFDFAIRVINLKLHLLKIAAPLMLLVTGVLLFLLKIAASAPLGIPVLGGTALLGIGIIMVVLNLSRTTQPPDGLQLRRRLAAAREWFKRELRSPSPLLDDQWFPYLLAFGLGSHVDRWFRAFGSDAAVGSVSSRGSFSGSSSPAASGGWTGGGGAFGGAGGTGSWAAAAGSMAAGVSAPGSSGGSGGGSSGGSSGGGGGGGW